MVTAPQALGGGERLSKNREGKCAKTECFAGLDESRGQAVSTVAYAATRDRVAWILVCRRGGDVDPACRASQDPSRKGTLEKSRQVQRTMPE